MSSPLNVLNDGPDSSNGEPGDIQPKDFGGNAAIVTLGCSKNLVDSEVMMGALAQRGFRLVDDASNADLVVVNTCAFLESAVEESIDRILEVAKLKKTARLRRLIVAGCLVERYRRELEEEIPEVDRFLSTDELLSVADEDETTAKCFDEARRPYFIYDESMPRVLSATSHSAYVKIAEGCDRPCSFCIIPKIRGSFRSRTISSIADEVTGLAQQGVKEFNLIAQDLTAYGNDLTEGKRKSLLPELLEELDQRLLGQESSWIRLFYAYPIHTDERLIRTMQRLANVCPYLDMPLQHVSNNVLKGMRRPLGEKGTRGLIDTIREIAPEIALRTTFLVGFPGETEEDIRALEEFVSAGHFEHVGVFSYSPETESDSYSYPGEVPAQEREERRGRIMEVQQAVISRKLQNQVGSSVKVLIDGYHDDTDLLLAARSERQGPDADGITIINDWSDLLLDDMEVPTQSLFGKFAQVEVTEVAGYDLVATLEKIYPA